MPSAILLLTLWKFQSPPSVRKATGSVTIDTTIDTISIPAFREEGDDYQRR